VVEVADTVLVEVVHLLTLVDLVVVDLILQLEQLVFLGKVLLEDLVPQI
tara:strand:+ start:239 stop:385 length:147 start_codon:yes stop_codon:yes gene_type:complete